MIKENAKQEIESKKKVGRPKGGIPWNKGKTGVYSKETIDKIKKAREKQVITEETKKKLSLAGKRRIVSEETKKKIREANLGEKSHFWKGGCEYIKKGKLVWTKEMREHIGNFHKGEKSKHWKGGITPENEKQRKSIEYKLWRKACFERDNFTCKKTGVSGGRLVVHHINNFSEFPELRTSIENGITLSQESHKEFHKIYGFKNNTKEQIDQYLNL
mgnify:CR=1 FL=1